MRLNNCEGAARSRPLALLFLLLLGLLAIPIAAHAAVEGRACAGEPNPTDLAYGDLITCDFNLSGDSDLFKFQGVEGEHIFVTATRPRTCRVLPASAPSSSSRPLKIARMTRESSRSMSIDAVNVISAGAATLM